MRFMSLVNFDSRAIFWIIITILFAILYIRSKDLRDKFEKELNIKKGDPGLVFPLQNGENHFFNPKPYLQPVFLLLSNIFKLSEFALIISAIAALFTIFY